MHIDELAPDMRHARNLADTARSIEFIEPGISIRVHPPGIVLEMFGWLFTFSVTREAVERRRRRFTRPGPFIPRISPEPRGLCLSRTR